MVVAAAATSVETNVGIIDIEASQRGVLCVCLPGERVRPSSTRTAPGAEFVAGEAARQLTEYFSGVREEFDVALDWRDVEPGHQRVLETLCGIAPYGTTVTYGQLGEAAGIDDPRDVGVFMARNPLPLLIPCHRVVASDGLGGYGGGVELKMRLLELEGVLPPRLNLDV